MRHVALEGVSFGDNIRLHGKSAQGKDYAWAGISPTEDPKDDEIILFPGAWLALSCVLALNPSRPAEHTVKLEHRFINLEDSIVAPIQNLPAQDVSAKTHARALWRQY